MKAYVILCNAVSVVTYLLWLGYHLLKGLGLAYGNVHPAWGPGDVGYVFVIVAVVTVACGVCSFLAPVGAAKLVALAPLAFILLGQGFIAHQRNANRGRHRQEQAARRSALEMKLRRISRDYVLKGEEPDRLGAFKESFLTLDRERRTLVRIDVGFESDISAYAFGRLNGDVLETLEPVDALEKFYRRYVDPEGRSVFDRYTLRHRPDQSLADYRLDPYEP